MTAKGVLLTVIVLLCLLFALFNLEALTATSRVNLLVTEAFLPLGLVLLLATVILSVLYFLLSLFSRAGQLKRMNDYEKRLEALRDELDQARFSELEGVEKRLGERLNHLEKRLSGLVEGLEDGLRRTRAQLDERILLMRNELAADIAAMGDELGASVGVRAPRLGGEHEDSE